MTTPTQLAAALDLPRFEIGPEPEYACPRCEDTGWQGFLDGGSADSTVYYRCLAIIVFFYICLS